MDNKYLERLIQRLIKEAPVDYGDYPERMDPRVQSSIEDPEGLYAKNRSFRQGVSDVERIAGKRFKEIVDSVKRYYGTEENITDPSVKRAIQMEQMAAVREVMSLENSQNREALRDLAVEISAKERGHMSPDITMSQSLKQKTITKKPGENGGVIYEFPYFNMLTFLGEQPIDPGAFQMKPKESKKLDLPANFSFDVDELTPDEIRQLEIEKRNVINALIQGSGKRGQFAYQLYKDRLDKINPRLYSLYNKIMSANDLMYFTDQQLIDTLGGNAAGASGKLDGGLTPGLTMWAGPSREQWRGMDPSMAHDIMGQTDNMLNEPAQFRVGGELVRKLRTLLPYELMDADGRKYEPYFEKILYSIPAEEFLKNVIANVVSDNENDNNKAKRKFEEILKDAKIQYDKFNNENDDEDEPGYDEDDDDILKQLGL